MAKIIGVLLISIVLSLFMENVVANTFRLPKGRLIYVEQADELSQFDFKTFETKKIFTLQKSGSINHLSFIDSNNLLFQAFLAEEPPNDLIIMKLNLSQGKVSRIRTGYSPMYMAKHNGFFFFNSTKETGPNLYFASLLNPSIEKRVTRSSGSVDSDTVVIPVSKDKIVFISKDNGDSNTILQYDLSLGELKKLPVQHCTFPELWRSATNQLVCFDREKYKSFLTDLDGKNVQYLNAAYPILYIPETDQMVISAPYVKHLTEYSALYIYDFKTGKTKKIVDDAGAGLGDAVYLPN